MSSSSRVRADLLSDPEITKMIVVHQIDDGDPISEFFANYPGFRYDTTQPPGKEFKRMCRRLRLLPKSPERKEAREAFNDAIAKKFNNEFGTDVDDLTSWKKLCVRIQVDPVPETLEECQRAS